MPEELSGSGKEIALQRRFKNMYICYTCGRKTRIGRPVRNLADERCVHCRRSGTLRRRPVVPRGKG